MFKNRFEAGRRLAARLEGLVPSTTLVVLGLPRGGVPVAAVVAQALGAPLEVLVARKLGSPANPEAALGAISEAGARYLDEGAAARFPPAAVAAVERAERAELDRRVAVYRPDRADLALTGRTVLIVDDGIATGATMIAAARAARILGADRVLAAAPVGPTDWREALAGEVDAAWSVAEPDHFVAVGRFYESFPQTSDAEVLAALGTAPRLTR
jgi:predicted phosphoribosyltransferase